VTAAPDRVEALREGELKVEGLLTDASNATLYCTLLLKPPAAEEASITCVYKPIAGERPLWDFPDGTLAAREVAAYEVSAAAGWDVVPPTLMREGPYGPGMCQLWIDVHEDAAQLLAVVPEDAEDDDEQAAGWCPIVPVALADDSRGLLAHRDDDRLRRIALFDAVINNADRKGGHLLPAPDGRIYAIDHGVSFHVEDKLRTLLWGFSGRVLTPEERTALGRLRSDEGLADRLTGLLSEPEADAFRQRVDELLEAGRLPGPEGRRRPIPWPPV
jgi:uncharacterized repeat protein (TIGR03843 family)